MAFESEQRIPNAVEPACGAMKFVVPSAAMQLEQKIAKASAAYVLFLHAHCVKNLLPSAVNQKDPGFGRFSLRAFEWRSGFFLNRAGYLNAPFWPT